MRELKSDALTTSVLSMGRTAKLSLVAGDVIDEEIYATVGKADRKHFRKVADAPADASTPEPAVPALPDDSTQTHP